MSDKTEKTPEDLLNDATALAAGPWQDEGLRLRAIVHLTRVAADLAEKRRDREYREALDERMQRVEVRTKNEQEYNVEAREAAFERLRESGLSAADLLLALKLLDDAQKSPALDAFLQHLPAIAERVVGVASEVRAAR